MNKSDAISLFGNQTKLCDALGIERSTFWRWDDPLPMQKVDQVRGAYARYIEERDRKATIILQPVDYEREE